MASFRSGMLRARGSAHAATFRFRDRVRGGTRPGIGVLVRGRRGGFFKKLFKAVGKVAKVVAPVVTAVVKTAASHTVVGKIATAVSKVKKRIPAGVRTSVKNALPGSGRAGLSAREREEMGASANKSLPSDRPRRRRKAKKAKKGGTAKQRAARARFARAARKGPIRKGARL